MEKDYILTQEGKAKLEEELHYLETESAPRSVSASV